VPIGYRIARALAIAWRAVCEGEATVLSRKLLVVASTAVLALTCARAGAAGTVVVRAGEDLQAAIDAAQPGDTIELEPGAEFVGNFVLRAKPGSSFITIRSAMPDDERPAAGVRVTPSTAAGFAGLRSPNESPVVQTEPGAHHWRLQWLELGPNATPANDVIRFGDGSSRQNTADGMPYELAIDQCYLHGDAALGQKRGLALNSGAARITNSYFADFKLIGQDAQAIAGWNGTGPYVIENNYLEASGENVLFGGADPAVTGLVPSDIAFRLNHVSKPTTWRRERWQVKNLFELKNAQRVLIEDNLFEHNWQAAQPGPAILFTPRNQDGSAPWTVVRDVTFRRNVVRHVAAAFNILGEDSNHPSQRTARIAIHHNLIAEVDGRLWGGNGVFVLLGDGAIDLRIDHNTVMQSGAAVSVYGRPTEQFVFTNNLVRFNGLGIKGDARASGNDTIASYLPGAVVTHNVFAEGVGTQYPPGNIFPSHAVWTAQFHDYFGGDYALSATSVYRSAGSDGGDIGVDAELLAAAMASPSGRRP
jgi:hypothetical protein